MTQSIAPDSHLHAAIESKAKELFSIFSQEMNQHPPHSYCIHFEDLEKRLQASWRKVAVSLLQVELQAMLAK